MANLVTIFFGPRSEFDRIVHEETRDDETVVSYLDSIRVYNARIKSSDLQTRISNLAHQTMSTAA